MIKELVIVDHFFFVFRSRLKHSSLHNFLNVGKAWLD